MGIFQRAYETYECMEQAGYAGKIRDKHETLPPVSHMLSKADIEIMLDGNGNFVQASAVDKTEAKIAIPVTEESSGRTSAPCAHPLCDQLGYLAQYNEKKHSLYVRQLTEWAESDYTHPKLLPILTYVKSGTILSDLARAGVIQLDENGKPEKEKLMVRWRLTGMGEQNGPCWTDASLAKAFSDYYLSKQTKDEPVLCMVTGEMSVAAKQHLKGIIPMNGNAKLISANDTSGFTYRGRFSEDWQTATVSYAASQKAHNALRWLAAEQGVSMVYGGRTFLCWNPQGKKIPHTTSVFFKTEKTITTPTNYREQLKKTLEGWKRDEQLTGKEVAVIAAFDAATTGRLSLTYYNELQASDFMDRLRAWDESCCWWNGKFGIQTPPLWQIVDCAFGTQRTEKGQTKLKTDDRIMKQHLQRLISCRVDRAPMPLDIEKALVNRASTPQAYDKKVWWKIVFTACAVINCYRKGAAMEWKLDKKDRSFQFGRLLAVMEKAERDTYGEEESREPNAIRFQSAFVQRPLATSKIVIEKLNDAYLPRLKPGYRTFYRNLITQIIAAACDAPERELNKPLRDTYLIGYSLQRMELYKSKKEKEMEDSDDERTTEQD